MSEQQMKKTLEKIFTKYCPEQYKDFAGVAYDRIDNADITVSSRYLQVYFDEGEVVNEYDLNRIGFYWAWVLI